MNGDGHAGPVGPDSPVISSISPPNWPAGQTTAGTINGEYFGTNPTVSLSDATISFSYTPVSDGQINFSATVPSGDVNGATSVTVTSNGYNGSGFIAMPNGGSQPSSSPASAALPRLACGSATRGSSATCTVSNTVGITTFTWKFVDGQGNTVNYSGASSWSGTAAQSGTVSVTWTGLSTPLPASLSVSARTGWAFTAASPVQEPNGGGTGQCAGVLPTLTSPPVSGSDEGYSCLGQGSTYNSQTISTGPNSGYTYITSATNTTIYQWEIVPDLANTSSTFYKAQCGNYNATTNPNGFISGANLAAQTQRHEIGGVQGHWGEYNNAQNSTANNVGLVYEGLIALPGASIATAVKNSSISADQSTIQSQFSVHPYPINDDQNGNFLGYINFAPYASCQ